MQILGKRSKVLLIAVAITMLVTIGVSFAMWDMSAVKATNGDLSNYANAKVGDIVTFGKYYKTGIKDKTTGEYEKTPIEWIVVDKDERTGQLTLMRKYILAAGSYFGNYYFNKDGVGDYHYKNDNKEIGSNPNNQAYVDSTVRAFLNNLERLDLGGDSFDATNGYIPSAINSTRDTTSNGIFTQGTGLLSSAGFSNQRYWTKLNSTTPGLADLLANKSSGLFKRHETYNNEVYFQRPIKNDEYKARPATRGFLDEAFTDEQKSMIVPKQIAGYTGHRWPDNAHDIATKSYVEGAVDKVWLPSATELNVMNGQDWNWLPGDIWTNPSDDAGSTVFEYFKNYSNFTNPVTKTKNANVASAIKTQRTTLAKNGMVGNYSIPVYDKGTTTPKTAISTSANTSDHYWTRSPSSYWYTITRTVLSSGLFSYHNTYNSYIGVRPCVILKY